MAPVQTMLNCNLIKKRNIKNQNTTSALCFLS